MSTLSSVILRDVIANLPTAGIEGRLFFSTDTLVIMWDSGTTWYNVTPSTSVPTATDSVLGLVKPDGTTITISAGVISATSSALGAINQVIMEGLDASKPTAGTQGRLYFTTDTGKIYYDNGTAWVLVGPSGGSSASSIQGVSVSATTPTTGQVLEYNGTEWVPTTPSQVTIGFVIGNGSPGTDVGPLLLAARAGTVSQCAVLVKSSDSSTALTFNILQNGTSVFSSAVTIAAGASPGSISTHTLTSTPLAIAKHDVFQINITSGNSNWAITTQLE